MKRPGLAVLMILIGLTVTAIIGRTAPQQQMSGGQAVTITQGGNQALVSAGGALKVDASGASVPVSGTFWQATQPVSGTVTANLNGSINNTAFGLNAGTAKIGTTYPYTSCGTTAFTKSWQAMPTASTAIATATTCIVQLQLSNTSGSAVTVTVSDNQGTPVNFLNGVTLLPGETRSYFNIGSFTSGIKVQASGAGVTYSLEGLQ